MTDEARQAKQVIIIRRDLGMRRGKEIAQGAHASMAWLSRRSRLVSEDWMLVKLTEAEQSWLKGLFTKVVCSVRSEEELTAVVAKARELGVQAHLVTDAGRTEFGGVPTVTAAAIGPDWADLVDQVTGELALY